MWWFLIGIFILTFVLVTMLVKKAPSLGLLDVPNARSSHSKVTPRGGGLAFVLSFGLACLWCVFRNKEVLVFWQPFLPAFLIAAIGFWDDKNGLSPLVRLVVQCAAAVLTIALLREHFVFQLWGLSEMFSYTLAFLALVWSTNLFNFMDGIDGIAGVEGLMVLLGVIGFYGFLGASPMLWLLGSLAAGVAGFLCWNWPQARIFMGDVGSGFLGFVIAVQALLGELAFGLPLAITILLFAVFWTDTSFTLIRRFLARQPVLKAHREHAYQRALRSGLAVETILIHVILLNLFLLLLAFWVLQYRHQDWLALAVALLVLSFWYWQVERRLPMHTARTP